MQRSYDVLFASSNKNKYVEVKQILHEHGIKVGFFKFTPVEIQSDKLEEIASDKARQASKLVKHPLIVEDAGLFVDRLEDFLDHTHHMLSQPSAILEYYAFWALEERLHFVQSSRIVLAELFFSAVVFLYPERNAFHADLSLLE